jgi:hypothetical protein
VIEKNDDRTTEAEDINKFIPLGREAARRSPRSICITVDPVSTYDFLLSIDIKRSELRKATNASLSGDQEVERDDEGVTS